MTEIMVTVEHLRVAQFCGRGARIWFERHGLDWNEFIVRGLPISLVENTGDAMGKIVSDIAREDAGEQP